MGFPIAEQLKSVDPSTGKETSNISFTQYGLTGKASEKHNMNKTYIFHINKIKSMKHKER